MRNKAGFMGLALLLLTVPALANAWTLAVKVAGGTDVNKVAVSYSYMVGTPGTASYVANPVTNNFKSASSVMYPVGVVTVAPASGFTTPITFDSTTFTTAAALNTYLTGVTSGNHTLIVAYGTTATASGLTLAQVAGGTIYAANQNSTWTTTGVSGLVANTNVNLAITPDSNHKVTGYLIGTAPTEIIENNAAGQVVTLSLPANNATITPVFATVAKTSVALNAPTEATTSNGAWGAPGTNPIIVTATAASNDAGLQYAFAVSGPQTITGQAKSTKTTFSFSPTTVGTYTVTATVTSTNDSVGVVASATVKVTSNQVSVNQGCTSCHSTQSPAIVSGYNASVHSQSTESSCEGCHTSATPHSAGINALTINPLTFAAVSTATNGKKAIFCTKCHTGGYPIPHPTTGQTMTCAACHGATDAHSVHVATIPPVVDALTTDCSKCHAAESGNFTASTHWITVANDGYHYDTNPLVPNEEARDLTCVYRCHFKATNYVPGSVAGNNTKATAYGCGTCHSGALAADGSVTATPTAVHGVTATAANTCQICHSGSRHEATTHATNHAAATNCIVCHDAHTLRVGLPHQNYTTSVANPNYRASYVTPRTTCASCHFAGPLNDSNDAVRTAWKESGHGDNNGLAWKDSASHVWKNSGTAVNFQTTIPVNDCVRCHTANGFAAFATSGFTNVSSLHATDKDCEPLSCNACHVTGAAARLTVPAVTSFYNVSTVDKTSKKTIKSRIQARFPDVGESNLCVGCHAARVNGPNLTDLANSGNWDLSNTSFQNSHYDAAAGTMYMKVGFKNFTTLGAPAPKSNVGAPFVSTQTYNDTLTALDTTTPDGVANGQNSAHRRIGTPLIAGSEEYLTAGGDPTAIATNGPCVTCHMKAYNPIAGNGFAPPSAGRPGAGHSLQIDDATAQQLCLQCHADAAHLDGGDGAGNGKYTTMGNLADLKSAMLEPQSAAFQNGLTLVKQLLLVKYQIKYDPAVYPYFYDLQKDATGKTAVTDWTRKNVAGVSNAAVLALGNANITVIPTGGLTQTQAYRLMGACFNLNVLARDPGAYVHARTYTQRLVFDTVDFLDNNTMDFTALTTARAATAAGLPGLANVFKGTNVNVHASDGTLATESMAWLAGTHYNDKSAGNAVLPLRLRP